jgi:GAF domain-containing protein
LFILYRYDRDCDELAVAQAIGELASAVQGSRISLGEQISGWVAANRQPIINSNPVLDLGEIAISASPQLSSCLSVPLVSNNTLVGVLSLHSSGVDSFSEEHRGTVEAVARLVASVIGQSVGLELAMTYEGASASVRARTR